MSDAAAFASVRPSGLLFKGEKSKRKKKKRKNTNPEEGYDSDPDRPPKPRTELEEERQLVKCSGRLVAEDITVKGFETKFMEEVDVGDVILIHHPQSLMVEERVVTFIASQRTLNIHEGFSQSFVSTCEFWVRKDSEALKKAIKQDQDEGDEDDKAKLQAELKKRLEAASTSVSTVERSGTWSYRTVVKKVKKDISKEEMLDMRIKAKHDKYC